jgi:hypothetical protein
VRSGCALAGLRAQEIEEGLGVRRAVDDFGGVDASEDREAVPASVSKYSLPPFSWRDAGAEYGKDRFGAFLFPMGRRTNASMPKPNESERWPHFNRVYDFDPA